MKKIIQFMLQNKKFIFIPVLGLLLLSYSYSTKINSSGTKTGKDEAIDQLLVQGLTSFHFQPHEINDSLSEKIFASYLKFIDYNKKFLVQADVDKLSKYKYSVDDDIRNGTFVFFDQTVTLIGERILEVEGYYTDILSRPFDFTSNETMEVNAEKLAYAKNKKELKSMWEKSLKYQVLAKVVEAQDAQNEAKAKSDTVTIKSFKVLEQEARAKLLKSHNDWFKRLKKLDRQDRLDTYFNAFTSVYDPHTSYFAPADKANFDIGMSGKLEGIGAQLQEKDGYIKVTNIVAGSASWRQGELKEGDLILKVAQGSADPVDITDMRLDEAVQLIRGKKGTEVRLTIKKSDGSILVIPIIRDIVIMEETFAKSVIIKGEKRIGYIKLPSFYSDFNNIDGGRNCSKDVKREIAKLKEAHVDGIILDLRNNGGGSLADVVDMAGLFIDKGPIVQVKGKDKPASIMEDTDPTTFYDGPLVVMVNANSASASEILAAAIQDYGRGVIVGTSQATFGKGTVQRFFDLDHFLSAEYDNIKPLGQVKITTQKFYRINGGATQIKGVIPDIVLPDPYYLLKQGEQEQDYPLVWDEIPAAKYQPTPQAYSLADLKAKSAERVKANEALTIIQHTAVRLKNRQDSTIVSLNMNKYVAEKQRLAKESKTLEALDKDYLVGYEFIAIKSEEVEVQGDTLQASKTKEWYSTMKKDIYLNETLSIITEMQR
jgi:carboxyl-terminal processing protease